MNVRFLGSGDAFGSGGRFQTCIHVESGGSQWLLDCGATSLVAMRRFGVDPNAVDAVLLTHLHGDHFGGVPFLVVDGQFRRRARPLTVAGPPGVEARVRDAMEVFLPGSSRIERKFAVTFVEWRDRIPLELDGGTVTPFEVVHPSGAPPYALRIARGGRTLAYSGDTEWTDALVDAARGTDLFIAEAYFYEKTIKYHLDLRTVLAARERLGCRRLVVTHMSDDVLRRLPGLAVEAAHDGKVIAL